MVRLLGWRALLIHSDPLVLDRWLWLRQHLRTGRVKTLDAGCGNGAFSFYAARARNEVLAVSFSQSEIDAARRRSDMLGVSAIEFRNLDLRQLAHHHDALCRFDQIICFETIEHVNDDEALVRSFAQILGSGGQLLLTAPSDRHRPLYLEETSPSQTEDGSHVRFGYSRQRLRQIVEGAGLKVENESLISGVVSQKLTSLMWRLRPLGRLTAWVIILPLRVLVVLDPPLTRLTGYPYLCVALRGVKHPEPVDTSMGIEGTGGSKAASSPHMVPMSRVGEQPASLS
jgi:SAM-dependent methyltransferase